MAEICREHELTAQMVSDWKAQFLAGAAQVFRRESQSRGAGADRRAGADGRELTMQLEIAKRLRAAAGTSSENGKRRKLREAEYPVARSVRWWGGAATTGSANKGRSGGDVPTYGYRRLTALRRQAGL
ncbi:MAG: hypothetical protein IPK19_17645 [Chloroflexi bacterium]|nr:hypothetical protein [Chloroflexota bacterium]